jgi:hypothetical protein
MSNWNDFNSADEQNDFDVIPKGTLVKVRMTIKPGGFDEPSHGWTGGYATLKEETGSVYLNCEFVVLDGPFARRKVWGLIGLHSPKGPEWGNSGRALIKGILNSSRGLMPTDNSPQAQKARCIQGFYELEGVEFLAKLGIEKDMNGDPKNIIHVAVEPNHKDYKTFMAGHSMAAVHGATQGQGMPSHNSSGAVSTPSKVPTGKPSWAQ